MKTRKFLSLLLSIMMIIMMFSSLIVVSASTGETLTIDLTDATISWYDTDRKYIPVHRPDTSFYTAIGARRIADNKFYSAVYGMMFDETKLPSSELIKSAYVKIDIVEDGYRGSHTVSANNIFKTALYPMAPIERGNGIVSYMASNSINANNPGDNAIDASCAYASWVTVDDETLQTFQKKGDDTQTPEVETDADVWDRDNKHSDYVAAYKDVSGFVGYPNYSGLTEAIAENNFEAKRTGSLTGSNPYARTLDYDVTEYVKGGNALNFVLVNDKGATTGNVFRDNTFALAGGVADIKTVATLEIELLSNEEILGLYNSAVADNNADALEDMTEAIANVENISFGVVESGYFGIVIPALMQNHASYDALKNAIKTALNDVTAEDYRTYKLGLMMEKLNSELAKTDDFDGEAVASILGEIQGLASVKTYLTVFNSLDDAKKSEIATFLKGNEFADDSELDVAVGKGINAVQVSLYPIIDTSVRDLPFADNETSVTLKIKGFVFKASKDGENKAVVTDANTDAVFALEKTTGENPEVTLTRSGDNITFEGTLVGEQEYKFSWNNVVVDGKPIADGSLLFTTTGTYVSTNVELSNGMLLARNIDNAVGKTETEFNLIKGVLEKSQVTNSGLSLSNVEVTVDPENKIFTYDKDTKKFTSTDIRGVSDVKFTYTNEDESKIDVTKKIFVYNSVSDSAKANTEYVVFDVQGSENPPYGKVTLGGVDYNLKGNFKEQVVVELNDGKVYVDGVVLENAKMSASDCSAFENVKYVNLSGEECYAEFVKAKATSKELKGSYSYVDSDLGDTEDGTTFRWLYASSENGSYTEFATEENTSIVDKVKGKYVKFEVTPKNAYETGKAVESEPIYIEDEEDDGERVTSGSKPTTSRPVTITKPTTPVVTPTPVVPSVEFTDVPATHWAKPFIDKLVGLGVLEGMGDGTYAPENKVTRGQLVCALVKGLKLNVIDYTGNFGDVYEGDWYAPYIATANSVGVVNGMGDGNFAPLAGVTKEQLCVIAANVLKLTDADAVTFVDAGDISPWALDSVGKAVKAGIVGGNANGYLNPKATATRAEMAKILSLIMDKAEVK